MLMILPWLLPWPLLTSLIKLVFLPLL